MEQQMQYAAQLIGISCQKHMFLAARMDEVERVETLTVPFKVVREGYPKHHYPSRLGCI